MKPELFAELMASANQALEHAEGKRSLRTTALPQAPKPMSASEIRKVRDSMQASQAVLARYLNVSPKLVQAWEAERRTPTGPALVLLQIMKRQPAIIEAFYSSQHTVAPARSRAKRRLVARR